MDVRDITICALALVISTMSAAQTPTKTIPQSRRPQLAPSGTLYPVLQTSQSD
jgi:hypothetical protein